MERQTASTGVPADQQLDPEQVRRAFLRALQIRYPGAEITVERDDLDAGPAGEGLMRRRSP